MAASTWYERFDSGEAQIKRAGHTDISTFKKVWIVKSVEDYTAAHEDFLQNLEGFQGSLQGPLGVYYFGFDGYTAKHLGNGLWEVEANYQTLGGGVQPAGDGGGGGGGGGGQPPPIGVITNITFDTTGGTQHITSALGEKRYGTDAPDMRKAINVTEDSVDGCDITVPVFEWSEEYEIPGGRLTAAYLKAVADLTGTVNDAEFRTFPKGEVLFLGTTGSQTFNPNTQTYSEASVAKIAYRFARSKNKTGQTEPAVDGIGAGYDKEGWEYLWIHYDKDVQGNSPLAVPKWIYVDKVYEYGNFTTLRLPTS